MSKKSIMPTNEKEELVKGRLALWLSPADINYLSKHCCCGENATQEQIDRCMRIRFRASAALHKSDMHTSLAKERLFKPEIYPGLIERSPNDIVFILWQNNALGEYTTWSLFTDNNQQYYIRRVIWRQYIEYKLKEPDTFATEYMLPKEIALGMIESLKVLNVGHIKMACERPTINIDGIEYGIMLGDIQLSWKDKSANDFAALITWYEETVAKFNELIPESSATFSR